jgi:hypothetical protein
VIKLAQEIVESATCSGVAPRSPSSPCEKTALSTPLLLSDVLDRMITGALKRHIEKRQLKRDFGFKALK